MHLRTSIVAALLAALVGACGGEPVTTRPSASERPRYRELALHPDQRYQIMTGWEATAQAGQEHPRYLEWRDELLDRAVTELGINRLRVAVRAGVESDRDNWRRHREGELDTDAWRCVRYATVNDNADPMSLDTTGFHFSELDHVVETVVLPFRERLRERGEDLYLNVNYTAFTGQICPGGSYLHDEPEEYAEFALATLRHLDRKYGIVPDAWELVLEPDNTEEWDGRALGRALVAARERLAAAGYTPAFIGPSTTSMAAAVPYFDQLVAVPGAAGSLEELAYHRYLGVSVNNLEAIAERAEQYGIRTAMLERIGASYDALYRDLTVGQASAWQQFALGFPVRDNGAQYFWIETDSTPAVVHAGAETAYLARYFRHVRAGARRIGIGSGSGRLRPVAFINRDEGHVVVVQADGESGLSVTGLPAGDYEVIYTTRDEPERSAGVVHLADGQALNAGIPDAGVLTIAPVKE